MYDGIQEMNEQIEEAWKMRRLDSSRASEICSRTYEQCKETGYTEGMALSLLIQGLTEAYASNHQNAVSKMDEALELASGSENHRLLARIFNSKAMISIIYGHYGEALELVQHGLEHAQAASDVEMLGYLNFNMGEMYRSMPGMAGEGIPYLLEARKLCQDDPHPHCSAILMSLAKCYQQTGMPDKALHYAALSLKMAEKSDDLINKGSCYEILAEIHLERGDYEKSHHYCDLSFKIREPRNEKFSLSTLHLIKSHLYNRTKDYDAAISHALLALELCLQTESISQFGDIQLALAHGYEGKGMEPEAGKAYKAYVEHIAISYPKELENKLGLMSSRMKLMQAENLAEIHRLRHVELKSKTEQLNVIHEIGKKITSSLNLYVIIETLYDHLKSIMQVDSFAFAQYHQGQKELIFDIVFDLDKRLPPIAVQMDNPNSLGVRCVLERKAIHIRDTLAEDTSAFIFTPESPTLRSIVYFPLIMDDIILGVISIQSTLPDSYTNDQVEWLRQVCLYVSIAVNNAKKSELLTNTAISLENTLNALRTAQERLVRTEKLAALGELVAGVAHEINTPLGLGITLTSYISERLALLKSKSSSDTSDNKDCSILFSLSDEVLPTLQSNLERVATIVNRFKTLAMNPAFLTHNSFDVCQTVQESIWNYRLTANNFKHHVSIICDSTIEVEGYPGALSEVIGQLLDNSNHHAFASDTVGEICINVHRTEQTLIIRYEDNGIGIPADLIDEIYNPFVTSKKNKGHIGLGLHLAHNLVTQVLHGTIEVDRSHHPGTAFIITLNISSLI